MELIQSKSVKEREDLVQCLLASLPRSSLVNIQKSIVPLLQLDVVALLPTEVALHIFSYLSSNTLLQCGLVSRCWRTLADDHTLWKRLCTTKRWHWKNPPSRPYPYTQSPNSQPTQHDTDDEGMGDEEIEMMPEMYSRAMDDSGFSSFMSEDPWEESSFAVPSLQGFVARFQSSAAQSHNTGSYIQSGSNNRVPRLPSPTAPLGLIIQHQRPNYKLLHLTHTRLQRRFLSGSYRLSTLQSRGTPGSHTNTIYCLQLYTYPETGDRVLFTGSKDRTIKEWDLVTGAVLRTFEGIHEGSVLSICVYGDYLASAGSDSNVVVWDLVRGKVVKVIDDHEDSVLCVRFDDARLVSCSKDRTVRTYLFPDLDTQHIMTGHRAAVNALSISPTHIVSASGDRSLRLWDANTGALLRTFENHHSRGIASIDLDFPIVLSGSSDKHIRLFNLESTLGWSTSSEFDAQAAVSLPVTPVLDEDSSEEGSPLAVCPNCGVNVGIVDPTPNRTTPSERLHRSRLQCAHGYLVRSVALNSDFAVSGSYDFGVKVWDRKTGRLVTDLVGGHIGRIFSVSFDCTKVVSCGEDQRICIWDFGGASAYPAHHHLLCAASLNDSIPLHSVVKHYTLLPDILLAPRNLQAMYSWFGDAVSSLLNCPTFLPSPHSFEGLIFSKPVGTHGAQPCLALTSRCHIAVGSLWNLPYTCVSVSDGDCTVGFLRTGRVNVTPHLSRLPGHLRRRLSAETGARRPVDSGPWSPLSIMLSSKRPVSAERHLFHGLSLEANGEDIQLNLRSLANGEYYSHLEKASEKPPESF